MKNKIQKLASLILVLMLAFSCFVLIPTSAVSIEDATTNIFGDGSFENADILGTSLEKTENSTDFDNWYRKGYGGQTHVGSTEEKHTGEKSLKLSITDANNYWATYTYYKNIQVEKNTNYSISFWYKMTEAESGFRAAVTTAFNEEATGRIATFADTSIVSSSVTEDWVQVSTSFNSGDNDVVRLLFRLKDSSGTGAGVDGNTTVYVDDIVLNYHGAVFNGGFESTQKADPERTNVTTDTALWYRPNSSSAYMGNSVFGSTEASHSGAKSLKMSISSAGGYICYYNNFAVEKNQNYKVSFYYKATVAATFRGAIGDSTMTNVDNATGRIQYLGSSTNYILSNSTTSDWVKVEKTFNSGENELLKIMVRVDGSDGSTVYIDDIFIKKIEPYSEVEGNVFTNSGFETAGSLTKEDNTTDTENWYRPNNDNVYAGTTTIGSNEKSYTGLQSLKLGAEANYNQKYVSYKNFAVKKNTDYIISFYYNIPAIDGSFYGVIGATDCYSNDSGTVIAKLGATNSWIAGGVSDGWVKLQKTFNSGDNEMLRLLFRLTLTDATSPTTVYIDDVVIKAVEAGDADGDGFINSVDLTVLRKVLLGNDVTYSTTGCQVRGEAEITLKDLVALKKQLANIAG